MKRAIWSAPPPGPAGMTNWMGLVGSHACAASGTPSAKVPAQTASVPTDQLGRLVVEDRAMVSSWFMGFSALRDATGRDINDPHPDPQPLPRQAPEPVGNSSCAAYPAPRSPGARVAGRHRAS